MSSLPPRPRPRLRDSHVTVAFAAAVIACTGDDGREPPPLPDDAVHVVDYDTLSIYKTYDEPVCAGDLRQMRMLWDALPAAAGAEELEAIVILYDYSAQYDALPSLCNNDQYISGCGIW